MKYRLLPEKKYYLGGKRLDAGSEVELSEAQFAGLSDRFEQVAEPETKTFRTLPAASKSLGLADVNMPEAVAIVSTLDSSEALDAAGEEEKSGKDRKGVHDAIEARRAELEG